MLRAAVLMAYGMGAKKYCESNGVDYAMVLRGADIKFLDRDPKDGRMGVTMQFRKLRPRRTRRPTARAKRCMSRRSPACECVCVCVCVCVVTALLEYQDMAPRRVGTGPEALQPLFRWSGVGRC